MLAADYIRGALAARGAATIVLATGASQFVFYEHLVQAVGIDWSRVTAFHLDEYVGIGPEHPASFRRYLRERFVAPLPVPLAAFVELDGTADPEAECVRVGELLRGHTVDVCCCGIGENGHLAFNDPPAEFVTAAPFHVVALDAACRAQQVGEGWFPDLAAVPTRALSMTIPQILASRTIVCTVPDARKATAVYATLKGPITPDVPASALRRHPKVTMFLDDASAALVRESA